MVIGGGGGFIGGHLVKYIYDKGFKHIRAVDMKPYDQWYTNFILRRRIFAWIAVKKMPVNRFARERQSSITWLPTWAAWASSNAFAWNACEVFLSTPTWRDNLIRY